MDPQERQKLLDETKAMVKSLVIPYQDGVFLRTLCNDYFDIEGHELPYKKLGFKSLKEFLNNIPDVVRPVVRGPNPWDITLFPVADASTAHIVSMVASQASRGKPKRRPKPIHFIPSSHRSSRSVYNSGVIYGNQAMNRTNYYQGSYLYNHFPQQHISSYNVPAHNNGTNQIHSLTRTISNVHQNVNGQQMFMEIPVRVSPTPNQWTTLTKSTSAVTSTTAKDSFTTTTATSTKTISSTRSPLLFNTSNLTEPTTTTACSMVSSTTCSITRTTASSGTTTSREVTKTTSTVTRTITRTIDSTSKFEPSLTNWLTMTFSSSPTSPISAASTVKNNIDNKENQKPIEKRIVNGNNNVDDDFEGFNAVAVYNFRKILSKFPDGLPACKFASEYKLEFGIEFNSREWGYGTPMELFHCVNKIFAVQPPDSFNELKFPGFGDEPFLYDTRYKKFTPIIRTIDPKYDGCVLSVSDNIVAKIMKLVDSYMPAGIEIDEFLDNYNANYNEEIDLSKYRFTDCYHLFLILAKRVPIYIEKIDKRDRVFMKEQEFIRSWIINCSKTSQISVCTAFFDLPPDIVIPGESYRELELPEHLDPPTTEWGAALITTVVTPKNFFVQLQGNNYRTAINNVMDQLDQFYNSIQADQYKINESLIYVNMPIASLFPGDEAWHRAKITKIIDKQQVRVAFVDYGGTIVHEIKKIRFLKREFFHLPAQSIRCSLASIKSSQPSGTWTLQAKQRLLDFSIPDYCLACKFVSKKPDLTYEVYLCDTNDEDDKYIHELLIKEGYAVFENDVPPAEANNSFESEFCLVNSNSPQHNKVTDETPPPIPPRPNLSDVENDDPLAHINSLAKCVIKESNEQQHEDVNGTPETRKTTKSIIQITRNIYGQRSVNNVSNGTVAPNFSRFNFGFIDLMEDQKDNENSLELDNSLLTPIKVNEDVNYDLIKAAIKKTIHVPEISNIITIIYYDKSYWITKHDLDLILTNQQLWRTMSRSGGQIKGHQEINKKQAFALCIQLTIQSHFDPDHPFIIYSIETVFRLCNMFKLSSIIKTIYVGIEELQKQIYDKEFRKLKKLEEDYKTFESSIKKYIDLNN